MVEVKSNAGVDDVVRGMERLSDAGRGDGAERSEIAGVRSRGDKDGGGGQRCRERRTHVSPGESQVSLQW
jgi:hypothetical protein